MAEIKEIENSLNELRAIEAELCYHSSKEKVLSLLNDMICQKLEKLTELRKKTSKSSLQASLDYRADARKEWDKFDDAH